jgi:hypothetical protein
MNNLQWLQNFYKSNCNGEWEHTYGIKIDTLDNPGWMISIDLRETIFERYQFNELRIDRSKDNWIICKLENGVFKGNGGAGNLEEIIGIFRNWVDANK